MIRHLIGLPIILLASLWGNAQIQNVQESFSETPRGWKHRVQNLGDSAIVAVHATFQCPKVGAKSQQNAELRSDYLVAYGHDKPIPAGAMSEFPMQPWAADCPGGVDAVIYANGKSQGDPKILSDIYERRRGVFEGIAFAQKLVDSVANSGADPNQVASVLRARISSVNANTKLSVSEWRGEIFALSAIAIVLEDQHDLLIPSDNTPQHQQRVEQVMAEKNISHQQAHAIVIGRKLRVWSTDLEGNLQPAPATTMNATSPVK